MAGEEPLAGWRRFVMEGTAPATGLTPGPASSQPVNVGFSGLLPPHDVIDALPPAAADKLRALRVRAADAHRLIPPFEEQRQLSMEHIEAQNRLTELVGHPQDFGHNLSPTDASVVAQQKLIDKLAGDLRRLNERSETRREAWAAAGAALQSVEGWLRDGKPSGVLLQDFDGPEPQLRKGENNLLDAVENRRRRCRELKADQHRIQSAPFPSSYAKAQMRQQIAQLAEQGQPSVALLVEIDGKVEFATTRITSEVHGERRSLAFTETADAVALVAWLHKDALIAALDREISTESDDPASLSHEARQQREAEAMGDLLAVEREESFFVWSAMEKGLGPVEHRSDCDPRAILQIQLTAVPRADPSPPSTEGLVSDLAGGRRR